MSEEKAKELTPQQELFCVAYTRKGSTFSNITLSYAEAYDYDLERDENGKININSKEYRLCSANGSRLFGNDNVRGRIRKIWLERLNEEEMDARLSEIALNGQETNSIQAIKHFSELKGRITKKIDLTTAGRPLQGLSDDELKKLVE